MKDSRYSTFLKYVIPCVISMASMAIFTLVDTANTAFMSSVWLSAAFFVVIAIPSILFSEQIAGVLGAEGITQKYGADYLRTYMYFAIPSGGITILSAAIRNDNNPSLASVSLTVSSIANIFLDWLFVFPLKMEVVGASLATGISQVMGLAILLLHFVRKKGQLRLSLSVKPKLSECRDMLKRGFPECISQLTTPVITICYNLVLANLLGDMGLQAYAIISQPVGVIIMLLLGVADGTQPLFSHAQSVGDGESKRYFFKKAIELNIILSVAVYGLFFFFGKVVFQIFGNDPVLLDLAQQGNRIYGLNFLFSSVTMVIACYFVSIVETKRAIIINVLRTFVFNVLFILLVPYVGGKQMVWAGIVFAELAVMVVAIFLYRRYRIKEEKLEGSI